MVIGPWLTAVGAQEPFDKDSEVARELFTKARRRSQP